MVRGINLPLPQDELGSNPVTPVNRDFPPNADPAFATAILSPSSNEVFAARSRARSRSDAYIKRSSMAGSDSPFAQQHRSASVNRTNANHAAALVYDQEPSLGQSQESIDMSIANTTLNTPDTSFETAVPLAPIPTKTQVSTLAVPMSANMVTVRRKSNTISMPAINTQASQDVFGSLSLAKATTATGDKTFGDDVEKRPPGHRRMTVSAPTSILRSGKPAKEGLRKRQSLRIIVEPMHFSRDQESPFKCMKSDPSSPIDTHTPTTTRQTTSPSDDDSINAFQQLIQSMAKERPSHSALLSDVEPVAMESIDAVLDYRRSSPSSMPCEAATPSCDLCGALARRLTILEPCGHFACAACCSSGLNQVTATPPRPHVCASCHCHVHGITLYKKGYTYVRNESRFFENRCRLSSRDTSYGFVDDTYQNSSSYHQRVQSTGTMPLYDALIDFAMPGSDAVSYTHNADSTDIVTEDGSYYGVNPIFEKALPTQSSIFFDGGICDFTATPPMMRGGAEEMDSTSAVVRMDNIPWTVTYTDVLEWLPKPTEGMLPDLRQVVQPIHIPIDVVTGKTANCCFIECRNKQEAMRLVRHRNNTRLMGRPVSTYLI
jgi:hypothetical protein